MEQERSGRIMGSSSCANPNGDERAVPVKPFDIPKRLVVQAWRLVRANRGAPGVDEESLELFERDLKRNLYRIWNRMSSGSYFPAPVKEVLIPKKSGGQRALGIPTVSDRVAQTVVKLVLEPELEPSLPRGLIWVPTGKISSSSNRDHPQTLLAVRLGARV